jgi:flagellar basal-body rod modification protein FlgD
MSSPISGSTPTTLPAATAEVNRSDQMGKDTFLKLLVAQMRYQDPSNPTSSSEFMAQTATFTQVEKLEQIASQNAELLTLQRSLSAGALVGHQVSYTATDGTTKTGTVSSVKIAGTGAETEPQAMVGGVAVALGRITEVALPSDTDATAAPSTTPAPAPTA